MGEWIVVSRPFQHYFRHIKQKENDNQKLYAIKPRLCLERILFLAGFEPGPII